MKHYEDQALNFAPDERGGAAIPKVVPIGDKEVPFDELVNAYRNNSTFQQQNHERAEQNKAEYETIKAERAALAKEREIAAAERQDYLESLRSARTEPSTAPTEIFDIEKAIREVDFLADQDAPTKLAQSVRAGLEQERNAMMGSLQQELANIRTESANKVAELERTMSTRDARKRAREEAEEYNDSLFERTMKDRYSDVLAKLKPNELEDVKQTMKSFIHDDVGGFDQAAEWRWNDKAVDRAVRASEASFNVILARQAAEARLDGLTGRAAGEFATDSTPNRLGSQRTASPDEGLVTKMDQIRTALAAGQITPEQAMDSMGDIEEARKILSATRR